MSQTQTVRRPVTLHANARRVYNYVRQYKIDNGGTAPNIREIAAACGLKSTSNTVYWLNKLKMAGLIEPSAFGRSRGIQLAGEIYTPPAPLPVSEFGSFGAPSVSNVA